MSLVCSDSLTSIFSGNVLIVGVGDREHGDDWAGSSVAELLEEAGVKNVIDSGTSPELDIWRFREAAPNTILFVDVVDFGGSPGDIALMEPDEMRNRGFDTHRAPIRLTMQYLESELGCRCLLLGIQPRDVRLGAAMCDDVRESVENLTTLILRNVSMN